MINMIYLVGFILVMLRISAFFVSSQILLPKPTPNIVKVIFIVSHSVFSKSILHSRNIFPFVVLVKTFSLPLYKSIVKSLTISGGTPVLCCYRLLSERVIFIG